MTKKEKYRKKREKFQDNRHEYIRILLTKNNSVSQCHYCKRINLLTNPKKKVIEENPFNILTIDHKIPLSKGGHNTLKNMLLSCQYCNTLKDNMLYEDFIHKMKTTIQLVDY